MTESEGATIIRTFKAPRELVFEAFTTPAHFAHWWGGTNVEVPLDSIEMDVRVDGTWKASMILDGGQRIDWVGEYLEVDPPSKLVMTISDGAPEREIATVLLTEVEGGTEMNFHQGGGHLDEEGYRQVTIGYNTFFDAMEELFVS